ncbi:reticulocalbin-2 [Sceloporus undulatus]|uniref:reticulocalbin-2 n=1 Tax=Sceloporus undulatus TaxID=8520 RepID=UPI001C4CC045|nr:reticulocalbin-2 [Sceloporus undulatus]
MAEGAALSRGGGATEATEAKARRWRRTRPDCAAVPRASLARRHGLLEAGPFPSRKTHEPRPAPPLLLGPGVTATRPLGLGERAGRRELWAATDGTCPTTTESAAGGQYLLRKESIYELIILWGISTAELSSWIQQSFRHYVVEDSKQQFGEYDKNDDGYVSWEEYNIQMYDRVLDFDEDTTLEDAEEESFRQLHLKDKKRFEKANRDGIDGLNLDEFIAFEHPEEAEYMKDFVIQEALEEHDKNGDEFVSLEEFLGDYRRDPTAREDPEWIRVEKDRFSNDYDKDQDGKLDPKELLSWVVPNNEGIAQEEASHLIEEMDQDGDSKLTEAEILENQDLFLNSEATDYGRQLHDENFYHEEL